MNDFILNRNGFGVITDVKETQSKCPLALLLQFFYEAEELEIIPSRFDDFEIKKDIGIYANEYKEGKAVVYEPIDYELDNQKQIKEAVLSVNTLEFSRIGKKVKNSTYFRLIKTENKIISEVVDITNMVKKIAISSKINESRKFVEEMEKPKIYPMKLVGEFFDRAAFESKIPAKYEDYEWVTPAKRYAKRYKKGDALRYDLIDFITERGCIKEAILQVRNVDISEYGQKTTNSIYYRLAITDNDIIAEEVVDANLAKRIKQESKKNTSTITGKVLNAVFN